MSRKNATLNLGISRVSEPPSKPDKVFKRTPKKHRARVFMLRAGGNGWTENEILFVCRLSSGRNYASELERLLGIQLARQEEANPDGIGTHLRYRIASRHDAAKIIALVNRNASTAGYAPLTASEVNNILNLYPATDAAVQEQRL
ncbi:hypothetical protein SOJ80_001814 [Cronobacter universalis]|nr:hypothetical protein [Cronobacter universalis]